MVVNDQIYYGSYTYNQTSGEGQLTIKYTDKTETKNFSVTGDTLYLDGYIYTQNYVQQAAGITGTWYSATGEKGIFMFDGLGGVYYEWTGKTYYGSYSFDTATGTGSLTLTVADETETTDFSLLSGQLIIEDEVFIREFVEQVVPQASATEAPPV